MTLDPYPFGRFRVRIFSNPTKHHIPWLPHSDPFFVSHAVVLSTVKLLQQMDFGVSMTETTSQKVPTVDANPTNLRYYLARFTPCHTTLQLLLTVMHSCQTHKSDLPYHR